MVAILEAAKNSNIRMFKEAYSKRIQQEDQQSDWAKNLQDAKATMNQKFGDYQLSDFKFTFEGDEVKGKLDVTFKGTQQFALAIVREDGVWKLDER
jgi:hypothetical protein